MRGVSKLRRQRLSLIHGVRTLLTFQFWFGITPVSEAGWKAKKLDEEDDHRRSNGYHSRVIDIFDYLRNPEVQGNAVTSTTRCGPRSIFSKMSAMQSVPRAASQYHTGASPGCVRNRTSNFFPFPLYLVVNHILHRMQCKCKSKPSKPPAGPSNISKPSTPSGKPARGNLPIRSTNQRHAGNNSKRLLCVSALQKVVNDRVT